MFGVAMTGLLLTFSLACAGVAGIVVAHRRAQAAADLGSLAGATAIQHGHAPCPAAADVALRNGGRLVGCTVAGRGGDDPRGGRDTAAAGCGAPHAGIRAGGAGLDGRAGAAMTRSFRRRPEEHVQESDRAGLVERVVAVAALRRLHARGAAVVAATRRDRLPGRPQPVGRGVEAALGEPGTARVAVVHEDGEPAGVGVQRGRDPADVPAVAGREQRQQADRRVLRRVRRARQVGRPRAPASARASAGQGPPHGAWCRGCARAGRAAPRRSPRRSAPPLEEGHDLVGDAHARRSSAGPSPQAWCRALAR